MVLYENKRIVIAGGGIAGLSTAWAIKQRAPQVDVVVLERGPRPGGNIRTEHIDGYVCESGPDGFLDTAPATMTLVHELGLGSRLLPSNDHARRRYIFRNGRLSEVPTSPGAFLKTPLLSTRGKLRILCEPFASARRDDDESISGFATRRIGREAAAVFVDPMVSGVYAGDAAALSLKACFPKMRQIEDDHGSLVRGLIATRRTRRRTDTPGAPAGRLTSFTGGMSDLVDGLTRRLGSVVHTSIAVTSVRRNHTPTLSPTQSPGRAYDVTTSQGSLDADAVVLSGPAAESAAIVRELDAVRGKAKTVRGDAREILLDRLQELDASLIEAVRAQCGGETLEKLAAEADEELRPFRARMPPEAYQQSHRACVDRLLRDRARLPTIAYE